MNLGLFSKYNLNNFFYLKAQIHQSVNNFFIEVIKNSKFAVLKQQTNDGL